MIPLQEEQEESLPNLLSVSWPFFPCLLLHAGLRSLSITCRMVECFLLNGFGYIFATVRTVEPTRRFAVPTGHTNCLYSDPAQGQCRPRRSGNPLTSPSILCSFWTRTCNFRHNKQRENFAKPPQMKYERKIFRNGSQVINERNRPLDLDAEIVDPSLIQSSIPDGSNIHSHKTKPDVISIGLT